MQKMRKLVVWCCILKKDEMLTESSFRDDWAYIGLYTQVPHDIHYEMKMKLYFSRFWVDELGQLANFRWKKNNANELALSSYTSIRRTTV